MKCPTCENEIKGNWCPHCKKAVKLGALQSKPVSATKFAQSAAMEQKGTERKKTVVDGFAESNARQAKYSSHLVSKDRASDFGNVTRGRRWKFAEMISTLVLLASAALLLVGLIMPFMYGTFGTAGTEQWWTGFAVTSFDWNNALLDTGAHSGVSMLIWVVLILMAVVALGTIVKLAGAFMPSNRIFNHTILTAVVVGAAIGTVIVAILLFGAIQAFIRDDAAIIGAEGSQPGIGLVLVLVASIVMVVLSAVVAVTRWRLNALAGATGEMGGAKKARDAFA